LEYNEQKPAILLIMENLGEATAYNAYNSLKDDAKKYAMSLLRQHHQGPLNRYGYPKINKITEKSLK
jgi:hypothetical protein